MRRCVLLFLLLVACDGDHIRLYHTEPIAPSLTEAGVAALDHLGPTLIDDGVNFSVFSAHAERIDLLLFDDPEDNQAAQEFELERFGDVWNLYVEGVGLGQHYGFRAWGPNWPFDEDWLPGRIDGFVSDVDDAGNRFNPNKLLMDPYARAFHRDHDWSKGSTASGPGRTQSTYAAAAKSVVIRSEYTWSDGEADWRACRRDPACAGHGVADPIVYEVHPKGFTADPSSGVDHPGTFRGIGEKASYLSDLGITAVELLPVHEKPLDGGYWGYNNLSFFAPELSYAADPDPREVIDEFKEMVDRLHAEGIEVWIDVVYNHTGEGGLWRERIYQDDTSVDPGTDADFYNFDPKETAGLFNLRGLDNSSYYALSEDGQTYWNNTGVGNQTRPNHAPIRRMILDSLEFYVEEMHVDGFRFDLAPVLGEIDLDYVNWDDPNNAVLGDIATADFVIENNVRLVAEPWSLAGFYLGQFPDGWGEWNAHFRDWWRSFVNYDDWGLNAAEGPIDGGGTLTGSYNHFAANGRGPWASQNFITVHDGFTMYDLVTYPEKQNGCGPLNPVCCDDPTSPWCELASGEDHNRSRDWGSDTHGEAAKRQMMRNFFAGMLMSQGTPLLLGGDEWMRTQHGNNNAFSTLADNEFNWFQWGSWQAADERVRMHDYVRQMIHLRKDFAWALAPATYDGAVLPTWRGPGGGEPDWGSRSLAAHYASPDQSDLLVLINMERFGVDFALPPGSWARVADTQAWFDTADEANPDDFFDQSGADPRASHNATLATPEPIPGTTYGVSDSTIVVLIAP